MFGEPTMFEAVTKEEAATMFEVINRYQQGEKRVARTDRRYSNEYATQQAVIEKLEELLLQERTLNAKYRESLLYAIAEFTYLSNNNNPGIAAEAACNLRNAVGQ